jgi:hypothetical protein
MFDHSRCTIVIESGAVNESVVERKTKKARAGIARLRNACDCPNFYKTKTERRQAFRCRPILIKACCDAYGILERQSETLKLSEGRTVEMAGRNLSSPTRAERER